MNTEIISNLERTVIQDLRQKAGLPAKKFGTRFVYSENVAKNPDQATVTDCKEARGFVYLNLNNGDSWAYYHPIGSPEVIYNFKDEPNYVTRELAPNYYKQAKKRAREYQAEQKEQKKQDYIVEQHVNFNQAVSSGERVYLTFRDRITDQYHIGYHDPADNRNEFHTTSGRDKAADYLSQHGQSKPKVVETWDYVFAPEAATVFDPEIRFINRYEPSPYMKSAQVIKDAEVPPTILRFISHALGNDAVLIKHFLNWLAVIFQYRIRTQTAWVLQGTTGTGKGVLFGHIIRPLIGEQYCRSVTLPNMEDNFNKFMGETLVLFVDEVDTDQVREMPKLTARLKNMITEPKLALRAMRTDLREVPNHLNLIMASNQPNSMRIEENDRRFNVCPRQEEKLLKESEKGETLIEKIADELPVFADYLQSHGADLALARQAIENDAKQLLQTITQTALEEVATALRLGDLQYFVDHMPDETNEILNRIIFDAEHIQLNKEYRRVVWESIKHYEDGKPHLLVHLDLFALFQLLVGRMPDTKGRLKKLLGHHRISIEPHNSDSTTVRSFRVKWIAKRSDLRRWKRRFNTKPLMVVK